MRKLEKNRVFEGNLILVNQNYPLRCTIAAKNLCPVFENQSQILMQQECAGMLDKLFQELNWSISEEIYQLIVGVSGYRTKSEQEEIFDDSLKENGRAFTEKYVAFPDHSEHQTGLAIDLAENREEIDCIRPQFPYQGICQKFREKIADFGFIERYPKEKQDITKIGAEPWHFRYVGVPHAEIMKRYGMALEEYIVWLKQFSFPDHSFIWRKGDREFKIGYVKAEETLTKIDLSEYDKQMQRMEERAGKIISYNLAECKEMPNIQISGNNVDGFVITYAQ